MIVDTTTGEILDAKAGRRLAPPAVRLVRPRTIYFRRKYRAVGHEQFITWLLLLALLIAVFSSSQA